VPVDAPDPARDPDGFRAKAMDMDQVKVYAQRIQSKHALFLFDSCFSGSLLFTPSRAGGRSVIDYKTAQYVRQFITAGDADEQVPDDSIFRRQFVKALEGEADLNNDGYVTGTELGEFLQEKVIAYSGAPQHPQYGKIRVENLDKGDFVFEVAEAGKTASAVGDPSTGGPQSPARVDPAQQELAFWSSIQNSSDVEDFKDYLGRYPNGLYAGIARRRVDALSKAAQPQREPSSAPAARPILGITLSEMPPQLAGERKMRAWSGLLVTEVTPGGLAAASGLRKDMVIQSVNGHAVAMIPAFERVLSGVRLGDTVTLEVSVVTGGTVKQERFYLTYR
jgi:hypothetical protein